MLLAGHIKPWKDCAPKERLDTRDGLAACPSHDVAFDVGLLTVRDTLEIVLSETLGRFVKDDELTARYYGRPTRLPEATMAGWTSYCNLGIGSSVLPATSTPAVKTTGLGRRRFSLP